jgi:transcriptional regulator with PAS, ATPase and Fis domain
MVFAMSQSSSPKRRGRPKGSRSFGWRSFFEQGSTPVFILGKNRRLRYANAAWEKICGVKLADVLELVCSARRHSSPLAKTLAPTPTALAGSFDRIRRPSPHARPGYQWWDITFTPLKSDAGIHGILGTIEVIDTPTISVARRLPAAVMSLRHTRATEYRWDLFEGTSPRALQFLAQLRHAAETSVPMWLVGAAGTGKETAARVVHHNGPQRDRAFMALDCVGLQPYLVESLLFGHGGVLDGDHVGTIYLKNPSALPRDLQLRIAEVFSQTRTPRLISGATRLAADEVLAGNLVQDFHSDLAVLELQVPTLRQRLDDLPRFATAWLPERAIDAGVFDVLREQPWPGNLRELRQVLLAAHHLAGPKPILPEHLPREYRLRARRETPSPRPPVIHLDEALRQIETQIIRLSLSQAKGKIARAAALLGIGQPRLQRRMKALNITWVQHSQNDKADPLQ